MGYLTVDLSSRVPKCQAPKMAAHWWTRNRGHLVVAGIHVAYVIYIYIHMYAHVTHTHRITYICIYIYVYTCYIIINFSIYSYIMVTIIYSMIFPMPCLYPQRNIDMAPGQDEAPHLVLGETSRVELCHSP